MPPNGSRLSCGRPVLRLSVDRRTPASQAPPGGRRPWSFARQPKRAAGSCSRLLDGGRTAALLARRLVAKECKTVWTWRGRRKR